MASGASRLPKRAHVYFAALFLSSHIMATREETVYRYSVSDIESSSIDGQEQLLSDSRPENNLPDTSPQSRTVLRDASPVSNCDDGTHSTHQVVRHDALYSELPSVSLLEKQLESPPGWPRLPQPVNISIPTVIWRLIVDIALLALSMAFLAFAIFVISYDQKPTASHRQAAERFEQASKWVSKRVMIWCLESDY